MKIRPKVPVCTDCDHVFEYKGQNPGQLGGVVVQFGDAYPGQRSPSPDEVRE